MRLNSVISKATAVLAVVLLLNSCKKDETLSPFNPYTKDADQAEVIDESSINSDMLLSNTGSAIDYIIDKNLEVNAQLTIEPGVTILFTDGAGITVNEQGSINAIGNSSDKILFTSQSNKRGSWKGITILSNSSRNALSFCKIEYGGGSNTNESANLAIGAGSNTAKAEISNCEITTSKKNGLYLSKGSVVRMFENNKINTNSYYGITMFSTDVFGISPTNEFNNNGFQDINLLTNQ